MPQLDADTQSERVANLFSFSFPSVCLLSVCNVLFGDSVFFLIKVISNRVPRVVRRGARLVNSVLNLLIAGAGFMSIQTRCTSEICKYNALVDVDCAKPVSLLLCLLFVISGTDRVSSPFFYPNHTSSFLFRVRESASVVIAWQLFAERESIAPLYVAFLISRRARFAFPVVSAYLCCALSCTVGLTSLLALGKNCQTVSQKAATGVLCTILLPTCGARRAPTHESGFARKRGLLPTR